MRPDEAAVEEIRATALPLADPGDLDPLLDRVGSARRYDALVHLEDTGTLLRLHADGSFRGGEQQTYPWSA